MMTKEIAFYYLIILFFFGLCWLIIWLYDNYIWKKYAVWKHNRECNKQKELRNNAKLQQDKE